MGSSSVFGLRAQIARLKAITIAVSATAVHPETHINTSRCCTAYSSRVFIMSPPISVVAYL